jgi:hypothetical protein
MFFYEQLPKNKHLFLGIRRNRLSWSGSFGQEKSENTVDAVKDRPATQDFPSKCRCGHKNILQHNADYVIMQTGF